MPAEIVHTPHENAPFTLALWTITESDETLQAMWERSGASEPKPEFKSPRRNREWLAARLLMDYMKLPAISYRPGGKPIIHGGYISLSHSENRVALVLADTPVGMDIQIPTEQIQRIHTKFCSAAEQARLSESPLRALTILWSAKEAIFKFWGENVAFAQDIEVDPFHDNDARLTAHYHGVHGNRQFELHHFLQGNHEIIVAL